MKLQEILSITIPKESGTTLIKVYRQDKDTLKRLAKESGCTMIQFISGLVREAERNQDK